MNQGTRKIVANNNAGTAVKVYTDTNGRMTRTGVVRLLLSELPQPYPDVKTLYEAARARIAALPENKRPLQEMTVQSVRVALYDAVKRDRKSQGLPAPAKRPRGIRQPDLNTAPAKDQVRQLLQDKDRPTSSPQTANEFLDDLLHTRGINLNANGSGSSSVKPAGTDLFAVITAARELLRLAGGDLKQAHDALRGVAAITTKN